MKLLFIGTGGGRINLIRQHRGTGGFLIKGTATLHVDPGPGALIHSLRLGQDPAKTDAIVITHGHIDHCNDAALMIEGMTDYALKKKGVLIGSRGALEGEGKFEKALSNYHQSKAAQRFVVVPGKEIDFKIRETEISLLPLRVKHDENSGFGFKLLMDNLVIGYTSDTEYFEELGKFFSGCDLLVVNNLKPFADGIPDHLASGDVVKILKVAKPKLAVLSHLGMKFARVPPEIEAERISSQSGVRTIAGRDGMEVDVQTGKVLILKGKEKGETRERALSDFE